MLQQFLLDSCIERVSSVGSAREAVAMLARKLSTVVGIDAGVIERAAMDRERARTTAFANGAAIPHCRLPGLRRFAVAAMVLHQPVRWDNYGHAVDTVMMIAGPTDHVPDHLRILANSSQLLDSPAVRAKLRAAPDAPAIKAVILAAEGAVEQRREDEGMLREVRKEHDQGGDYLAVAVSQFSW